MLGPGAHAWIDSATLGSLHRAALAHLDPASSAADAGRCRIHRYATWEVFLDSNNAAVLEELGWNDDFATALAALGDPAIEPGRVSADFGIRFLVETARGPVTSALSGPLRRAGRRVAVGDWVGLYPELAQIRHVLPHRTAIRRNAPGTEAHEQVLAANIAQKENNFPGDNGSMIKDGRVVEVKGSKLKVGVIGTLGKSVVDEVQKIDFQKMERVARTVCATLWEIANAAHKPLVDKQLPSELRGGR